MRRIAFFEDQPVSQFGPLTCLRPVFELVCGHFSLRDRLVRQLEVTEWGAFLRPHLADVFREDHPEAYVNDDLWLQSDSTFLINGRWLPDLVFLQSLSPGEVAMIGETVVAITIDGDEAHAVGFRPAIFIGALIGDRTGTDGSDNRVPREFR